MNDSVSEQSESVEAFVEQALPMLPEVGKLLYAAVVRHPEAEGLSLGQIKVTMYLLHHGRRTVGEIAAGLGVSMPTASELVERLVEAGMVERATDPADRRRVLVGLTPRAEAFGSRLRALRRAQLRAALERLAPAERPTFVRSLEALVEALRRDPEEFETEGGEAASPRGGGSSLAAERAER